MAFFKLLTEDDLQRHMVARCTKKDQFSLIVIKFRINVLGHDNPSAF